VIDAPRLSSFEHVVIEMMVWWINEGFAAIDAATAHAPTWTEVRRAVNRIAARTRRRGGS